MWDDLNIQGKTYKMGHLSPFSMIHKISDTDVTFNVSFGNHVFTDNKETGPLLYSKQKRYFSQERYERSLELADLIKQNFIDSYVVPYIDKQNNETYHYMEIYDYSIFFDIRKQGEHVLKLVIISAYEVDDWGRSSIPKGDAVRARYIAHLRLRGETYFQHHKRKRRQ